MSICHMKQKLTFTEYKKKKKNTQYKNEIFAYLDTCYKNDFLKMADISKQEVDR